MKSNGSAVTVLTDGWTDTLTGPILLPGPVMREVINKLIGIAEVQ